MNTMSEIPMPAQGKLTPGWKPFITTLAEYPLLFEMVMKGIGMTPNEGQTWQEMGSECLKGWPKHTLWVCQELYRRAIEHESDTQEFLEMERRVASLK